MRRQIRMVAVGVILVTLGIAVGLMPGCSQCYIYDLRVVVQNATDARPLPGVGVEIQGHLTFDRDQSPPVTAADGVFTASCRVSDVHFLGDKLPTWLLVLSKDGYQDEVIEISPTRKPDSGGGGEPDRRRGVHAAEEAVGAAPNRTACHSPTPLTAARR